MRYAAQSGIISYNPAVDMAGALTTVKRQHRPALALNRISELLERLDTYRGQPLTRLATKLTLLIFIRSSELRFARWSEIDFKKAMWTIPPERKPIEGVKYSHRGSKCVQSIWCHYQLRRWIFSSRSTPSAENMN
jgi:integrase